MVRKLAAQIVIGTMLLGAVAAAQPAPAPAAPLPTNTPRTQRVAKKLIVERVVAVVNDSIILSSELEQRMLPVRAEAMQIADPKERDRRLAKLTSTTLDEMVNEELIVQAADAAKVEVEAAEVQAALDEIKQQNKLDDTQLAQALLAQGYTLSGYKMELRRQILRIRAVNQLVSPKVTITDEDIRARYDQMQRRSDAVSAVALSHMLFKLPDNATEQQIAEAKARASVAMARVKAGEKFEDVARELSDDTSTKATGGQLGWFERGSMNPEWEPIVFSMAKGDIRGPVKGPQGLHVFLVTDLKQNAVQPYEKMKEQITRELRRKEMDKQTQLWLDELRKKAYIDIKLT